MSLNEKINLEFSTSNVFKKSMAALPGLKAIIPLHRIREAGVGYRAPAFAQKFSFAIAELDVSE